MPRRTNAEKAALAAARPQLVADRPVLRTYDLHVTLEVSCMSTLDARELEDKLEDAIDELLVDEIRLQEDGVGDVQRPGFRLHDLQSVDARFVSEADCTDLDEANAAPKGGA